MSLKDFVIRKAASKASEMYELARDFVETEAKKPRTSVEYIDRELMGTRFSDIPMWFKGGPAAPFVKGVAPAIGGGLTGLSLVGAHDIMTNNDYNYSFKDVNMGMTGLPAYSVYRGIKKIGENFHDSRILKQQLNQNRQ